MSEQNLKDAIYTYNAGRIFANDSVLINIEIGKPTIGKLIAAALNEKTERDFGECKRWIKVIRHYDPTGPAIWYECPSCKNDRCFQPPSSHELFNFCPYCGQRLLPAEENI